MAATETSLKVTLRRLRRDIDAVFGDGYTEANPVLLAAVLLVATSATSKPWVPVAKKDD